MKILKYIDKYFELSICMVLISGMTFLIAFQVFMRKIGHSLSWSEELARYMFIWLIYLGISYGASIMKHIKIEAALKLYPKAMRPYIVIVGDILFFLFAAYIAYIAWGNVSRQMMIGQTTPALGIPMWFIYAAPMVGFTLTALRQIQTIIYRFQHPEIDEEAETW